MIASPSRKDCSASRRVPCCICATPTFPQDSDRPRYQVWILGPIEGRQATPTAPPRSAGGGPPGLRNQFEKLKKKKNPPEIERIFFFSFSFSTCYWFHAFFPMRCHAC